MGIDGPCSSISLFLDYQYMSDVSCTLTIQFHSKLSLVHGLHGLTTSHACLQNQMSQSYQIQCNKDSSGDCLGQMCNSEHVFVLLVLISTVPQPGPLITTKA